MESQQQSASAGFWARIFALPVVNDVYTKCVEYYAAAKSYNGNMTTACTKFEEAVFGAYNYIAATEFVNNMVAPFFAAQLDKIEAGYPIAKARTEEVIAAAKDTYTTTVTTASEAVSNASVAVSAKIEESKTAINTTVTSATKTVNAKIEESKTAISSTKDSAVGYVSGAVETAKAQVESGKVVVGEKLVEVQGAAHSYVDQAKAKVESAKGVVGEKFVGVQEAAQPYVKQGKVAFNNAKESVRKATAGAA